MIVLPKESEVVVTLLLFTKTSSAPVLSTRLVIDIFTFGPDEVLSFKQDNGSTDAPFNFQLSPGTYRIQLRRRNIILYDNASVVINARKFYSFVAKGVANGAGIFKEDLVIIKHN